MSTMLIFDTCVLPRRGRLTDNPLLAAIIRIAQLRSFELVLVDVTLAESVNARRRAATEALSALRTAVRGAAKLFPDDLLDYYIPDESGAVDAWENELRDIFVISGTSGADAVEA